MSPIVPSLTKTHRANHPRGLNVRSYTNATSKEALNLMRAPTMIDVSPETHSVITIQTADCPRRSAQLSVVFGSQKWVKRVCIGMRMMKKKCLEFINLPPLFPPLTYISHLFLITFSRLPRFTNAQAVHPSSSCGSESDLTTARHHSIATFPAE